MDLQIEHSRYHEKLLEKSKHASNAYVKGDYEEAILLYTEALSLDPNNHVFFTNRSDVYLKTKQYELALEDGKFAAHLQPNSSKAHYRQAVALQCLGKYHESLAAFSSALAHDQKSQQLLSGIIDAALRSPFKDSIEKIFSRLKRVNMAKNPFVVVTIIGQELLNAGHVQPAITCLENALKIGTVGLRMRGSVISALTSAYWKMGNISRSVELMKEDLDICRSLADKDGECRVLSNLGNAYFAMKQHEEALNAHRSQLMIASKHKNMKSAALALSSIAHVYVSMSDYENAIENHNKAIEIYREVKDTLNEGLELGYLGAVHLLAGNVEKSIECHRKQLALAKELKNDKEIALAYCNLGSAYHQLRNHEEAVKLHGQALKKAETLEDWNLEARACAGLGSAYRSTGNQSKALHFYERYQNVAIKSKDRMMEGRALSNLGIIYLEKGECLHALKLHKIHLAICQEFGDRTGQGQAYGNMGCAYCALKKYDQAIKYHEKELAISKEVGDHVAEACTHGNLAVAYQGLGKSDIAREHYEKHLSLSRANGDTHNEVIALFNLGNFYSSNGNFADSIAYYQKYMSMMQSAGDKKGENKACHNLAFAHFSLGNLNKSVELYKQNIELSRAIGDKHMMARAYCNLGLVYKDLCNYDNSLMCQTHFQKISHEIGYTAGECRALGNIGDVYVCTNRFREAIVYYERQVKMAEKLKEKDSMCQIYSALGHAHKLLGNTEKALVFHKKELDRQREKEDIQGLFRALDHIGSDCLSLGRTDEALEYFTEQKLISSQIKDPRLQARVFGNIGLVKQSCGTYQEAMKYFGNQIEILERLFPGSIDLGRAQGNLAECFYISGEHEKARDMYQSYLTSSKEAGSPNDEDKAYQGLGNTYRALGDLQQALFCFENRLVFAHELTKASIKGSAYGELGNLHRSMGNFEQAAVCYGQQLTFAKECQDLESEGEAECGLGQVYIKMGDYETALSHHENELKVADKLRSSMRQSRAFGNIGIVYELMFDYKKASECQEQHLSIAAEVGDRVGKLNAYSSLARNHYLMSNFAQSISYFKQGLTIAETLGRREDEARIRYWLGITLLVNRDNTCSLEQLERAMNLYESLRHKGITNGGFQLSMHEQQSLCYQVIQRILVDSGKREEALVIAERSRNNDFIDFLLNRPGVERQYEKDWSSLESYDEIMEVVNKQNGIFVYYSLVIGYLFIWLIVPQHGIVKFHELRLSEETPSLMIHRDSGMSNISNSMLERLVGQIRENIGVEPACGSSISTMSSSLSGSDVDEPLSSYDGIPSVSRSFNDARRQSSRQYGFSCSSEGNDKRKGFLKSRRHDRKRSETSLPVQVLYDTLIAPIEEFLPNSSQSDGSLYELVLVLQGDLYLVPFALLHGQPNEYLHKRYSLLTVPSIRAILMSTKIPQGSRSSRIVVGDPQLPLSMDHYHCKPSMQAEAELVGSLFGTKPLTGNNANKDRVCHKIQEAECIHFATNTSWKHSALVLAPNKQDERETADSLVPVPSNFLLTASEISYMKIPAKMVILSCCQNESRNKMSIEGLVSLIRSFLLAGTSCILVSLWPVAEPAYRLLLEGFYKRFLRGMRASRALAHAIKLIKSNKEYDHPSNWAGFLLIGRDVRVVKKTVQLRNTLIVLIESTSNCRESLKVILHLIDKANQRLLNKNTSLMYTAEESIAAKLGNTTGWKDVLLAAGFRFRKASKNLPDAVFFPLKDEKGKLRQCCDILRSLLGLSPTTLQAICKVLSSSSLVRTLLELFNTVLSSFSKSLNNVPVTILLDFWHVTGCHELLSSMGFVLLGVGKNEVMLRSGGTNSKRVLQCAVVALNALTGGLGTDDVELNAEFPLRRAGSNSSLKSSISTISSFSYASAESTIEARSYHDSSRSHVSDIESILDDLEKCQEDSSVDPEFSDDHQNSQYHIPINAESRALSLDKNHRKMTVNLKQNVSSSDSRRSQNDHILLDSPKSPDLLSARTLAKTKTFLPLNVAESSFSPSSTDSGFLEKPSVCIPIQGNSFTNEPWNNVILPKSPVVDRNLFPFHSHSGEASESLDSGSSTSVGSRDRSSTSVGSRDRSSTSVGSREHKTPGSIYKMSIRLNGGCKYSDNNSSVGVPYMMKGRFERGIYATDYEHDNRKSIRRNVPLRSRSVSFDSVIDSDDTAEQKERISNDVEIFHALIKSSRGSRRTRGHKGKMNKRISKSEETLENFGSREVFSLELDSWSHDQVRGSSDVMSPDRVRGSSDVVSHDRVRGSSDAISRLSNNPGHEEMRLKNGDQSTSLKPSIVRRKLNSEYLANLKNLQASPC